MFTRDQLAHLCAAGAASTIAAMAFNMEIAHKLKAEAVVLLVAVLTYVLLEMSALTPAEAKPPPSSNKPNKESKFPTPAQLLHVIKKRRSIFPKDYNGQGHKPTEDDINMMLEAAIWAPTHKRTEPWRFVVLSGTAREKVWDITYEASMRSDDPVYADMDDWWADDIKNRSGLYFSIRSSAFCEEATCTRWEKGEYYIALCVKRQAKPDKRLPEWEELAAVSCAIQNLHLMATVLEVRCRFTKAPMESVIERLFAV
jgi:nitroreductase